MSLTDLVRAMFRRGIVKRCQTRRTTRLTVEGLEDRTVPSVPVAPDASAATHAGTAVVIGSPAYDPENDPLTVGVDTPPAHGTVTSDGVGQFNYTPDPTYVGPDSFTYYAATPTGGPPARSSSA